MALTVSHHRTDTCVIRQTDRKEIFVKHGMRDGDANFKGRTGSRIEHINVQTDEGVIRWYSFVRSLDASDIQARHDPDWYKTIAPTQSRLHKALDLAKRKLLFWR
jgi:hypothetical protein